MITCTITLKRALFQGGNDLYITKCRGFHLNEVTPTVAWTWSVFHLPVGVGKMLLLLLHLLSKVSAISMPALAGPTALTSSRLASPPSVPSGLRLRSSSLVSLSATVLMLGCPLGRLIPGSSAASRLLL